VHVRRIPVVVLTVALPSAATASESSTVSEIHSPANQAGPGAWTSIAPTTRSRRCVTQPHNRTATSAWAATLTHSGSADQRRTPRSWAGYSNSSGSSRLMRSQMGWNWNQPANS